MNRIGRERNDPRNGVWVYDMAGEDEPRQIVNTADLQSVGMPPYRVEQTDGNVSMWPMGLTWALDGTALVVSALDGQFATSPPAYMTYFVNVASGVVTPLIDFSGVPQQSDFFNADSLLAPGDIRLFDMPIAAAVSPDGKRVYMAHGIGGMTAAGLSIISLPMQPGVLPTLIYRQDNAGPFGLIRSSVSADGRYMALAGHLYTLGTE